MTDVINNNNYSNNLASYNFNIPIGHPAWTASTEGTYPVDVSTGYLGAVQPTMGNTEGTYPQNTKKIDWGNVVQNGLVGLNTIGYATRGDVVTSDTENISRGILDFVTKLNIPYASAIAGGLGFGLDLFSHFGKKPMELKNTMTLEEANRLRNSYTGAISNYNTALNNSKKTFSLLNPNGFNEANNSIINSNNQQPTLNLIYDNIKKNEELAAGNIALSSLKQRQRFYGDPNTSSILAKKGTKLPTEEEIPDYAITVEEIPEFKIGGKMNVIPDGAFHCRKNNMEVEGITKKGIPVVLNEEGGEIEQQAEIERNEIIFNKDVTTKLEELYKDGSDEAAIKAGKLLVEEILYNTDDKTGLIDSIEV